MRHQRHTIAPVDEVCLRLRDVHGVEPVRVAGDGALVRLADGTLGVVATLDHAGPQTRLLTGDGQSILIDSDALVQVLAYPVLAAKLLIQFAHTLMALDHADML